VPDHADRGRTPLQDLAGDLLEVGALLEQAHQRGRLLPDLGEEARACFSRWQWLRVGLS
jgi:hypothetical protein